MTEVQGFVKRLCDISFAAIGLFVTWPVILICVLVAWSDTKASGIYKQLRIGRFGQEFHVRKIRTMRVSESLVNKTVTTVNDSRITSSGRVMRRFKLDELPQLWNVLLGDMSFVGPRPDVPGYADRLKGEDRKILNMRPGITGPATIKYTNEEELLGEQANPEHYNDTVLYPDKVRLNLEYLQNYSLLTDFRYILVTLHILPVPDNL